mgnify:FL=1
MKKIIQITSGKGPAECERAVFMVSEEMKLDAKKKGIDLKTLDLVYGKQPQTLFSILFEADGNNVESFCDSWKGVVQWVSTSPFRRHHKRKNWFVGVNVFDKPKEIYWNSNEIEFQTLRSSGPGGQNVNKVESAVRATHRTTGISVTASDERSQLMNKKAAEERLRAKLLSNQMQETFEADKERWMVHNLLKRGDPIKIFKTNM